MKTMRIYLSVMALVLSVGGAIGSSLLVNSYTVAYHWVDMPGTEDDACVQKTVNCQDDGDIACTVTGISAILRRDNTVSTACGPELFRTP